MQFAISPAARGEGGARVGTGVAVGDASATQYDMLVETMQGRSEAMAVAFSGDRSSPAFQFRKSEKEIPKARAL